jgi:hypothetical protein
MRRILKMLARMYPAAWRERYGAEYEALIEDAEPRARDGVDVFWGAMKMRITARNVLRIVLPCALVGGFVASPTYFAGPPLYHSQTVMSVKTADPRPIDSQIADQTEDLLNTPYMMWVIQNENLYPSERARMPLSDVVNVMRKNILLRPLFNRDGKGTPNFILEFAYPDPHIAQRVDQQLAARFLAANVRARNASATSDFLKEQLAVTSDPMTHARIQSQLNQVEHVASHLSQTFQVVKEARLPSKPGGLTRIALAMIGMVGGLVGGIVLAAVVGWRRKVIGDIDENNR